MKFLQGGKSVDQRTKHLQKFIFLCIVLLPFITTWIVTLFVTPILIEPPRSWAYFSGHITAKSIIDSLIALLGYLLARGRLDVSFEQNKRKLIRGSIVAFLLLVIMFFL